MSTSLTILQTGSAILVLSLSIAIVAFAIRAIGTLDLRENVHTSKKQHSPVQRTLHDSSLEKTIDDAVNLNSLSLDTNPDPVIRLSSTERISPTSFAIAAREVTNALRDGKSVSIDLTQIDHRQACRLVDYCSGATSICRGWVFRMTETVIILTPTVDTNR